jgi:hypothetical protein
MSASTFSSQTLPHIIQNIILCEQSLDRTLIRTNLHRRRKTLEAIYNIMITLVQRIDELIDSESYALSEYQQLLDQLARKRQNAEEELANSYIDFGNSIEELDSIRVQEEGNDGVRESTQHALLCAINLMRLSREARLARGEDSDETASMAYILDGSLDSLLEMFGHNLIVGLPANKKSTKLSIAAIDIPDKFENWVDSLPDIGSTLNDSICCPITQEVMTDPVLTIDGYTFERSAITIWLETNSDCPLSRQPLTNKKLTINWNCRKTITGLIDRFHNHGSNIDIPQQRAISLPIYSNTSNKPQSKRFIKNLLRVLTN